MEKNMDNLELLIELHIGGQRQGPGGDEETRLALALSGLKKRKSLNIADIGCGTGASTRVLARELDAKVTAVDFLPAFLDVLKRDLEREGLSDRIETLSKAMEELPFEDNAFDAIWSEGAVYNMGFDAGTKAWRRFLKPGGILAVSELTWLTRTRPAELDRHWMAEYPEVGTAAEKINVLENNGYSMRGYFPLPKHCWIDNYYRPMQSRFDSFLSKQGNSEAANAIVAAENVEIDLYERNSEFISYGFYIAQRTDD